MTPESYINKIDAEYSDCKLSRLSMFSDEWDIFSRKINAERSEVIKSLDDEKTESLLNQCLSYWFNRSELLELHSKSKIFGNSKRKKLAKEGKKIKKDILNGKVDSTLGTKGVVDMFSRYHKINSCKGSV